MNELPAPPDIQPINPYPDDHVEPQPPPCSGDCLTAYDVGVPVAGNPVAYPHPDCPLHGWAHFDTTDESEDVA